MCACLYMGTQDNYNAYIKEASKQMIATAMRAIAKQVAKGPDWIVANDVSGDVMGGHHNRVHLVTRDGIEHWPEMTKDEVARRLIERISKELQ